MQSKASNSANQNVNSGPPNVHPSQAMNSNPYVSQPVRELCTLEADIHNHISINNKYAALSQ